MLSLNERDRVRVLSAVSKRGASYAIQRVVVITLSLIILALVPLTGLVRMDMWRGNHLLLQERVDLFTALKGFVIAMAILYGFTFLTNMIVGRFFCGFGCPVGYVSRLGEAADVGKSKRDKLVAHFFGAGFVGTFIGAIMLWWVDPRVMVEGSWTARLAVVGVFLVLSFGGFAHAFIWRFGFCGTVCPIGLYYRYVTSNAPVSIVFREDPSPCIECGSCEKICPVDLDPKALGKATEAGSYGDAECLRCGDCIEACRMVFKPRKGETPPLRFGLPGKHRFDGEGYDDVESASASASEESRESVPSRSMNA